MLSNLSEQTADSATTNHHYLDVGEVAEGLGFKGPYDSPFSDTLFVHVLAKKPPVNHYANTDETRYFSMFKARKFMQVASVVLLIGSIGFSAFTFFKGADASQMTSGVKGETAFYDERYRLAREQLPKSPAEAFELKRAVETDTELRKQRTSPRKMMILISQGLDAFPTLRVASLSWAVSADPSDGVGESVALPIESQNTSTGTADVGEDKNILYQLAFMRGSIEPFDGDYREAIDLVNGFADALSLQDSVEHVQILALPLNLSSEKTLAGGSQKATGTATFEVRVALRLEPKR